MYIRKTNKIPYFLQFKNLISFVYFFLYIYILLQRPIRRVKFVHNNIYYLCYAIEMHMDFTIKTIKTHLT